MSRSCPMSISCLGKRKHYRQRSTGRSGIAMSVSYSNATVDKRHAQAAGTHGAPARRILEGYGSRRSQHVCIVFRPTPARVQGAAWPEFQTARARNYKTR